MNQKDIILAWEQRAKAAGIPIRDVCQKAGISPSTFSRWKAEPPTSITMRSAQKIDDALAVYENADAAA